MANNGVSIYYGDIAPGAKENFAPSMVDKASFVQLNQLNQNGLFFPNYGNPCELYSVVLDGRTKVFPSYPETKNMGIWSEQISDENGVFDNPITLTLQAKEQYSSQGFTFTFDTYNNIYPTRIHIQWFREIDGVAESLDSFDFEPDSANYFAHHRVDYYNKVVITFLSMNMPKNRLKLRDIDYGYGTIFYGDELRSTRILQEIDPISSEISVNTADFVLDSHRGIDYSFQEKQPLSIYFNGQLKATTFVKQSKRKSKFLWDVRSEDYIGFLDRIPFVGGIYKNKNAVELIEEIFSVANVPYKIDASFSSEVVTGYIPYSSCREALAQVAFAIQAIVDTSNSDVVRVYKLNETITQKIPLERTMQGQSFTEEERITSVEMTEHSYALSNEAVNVYSAEESGSGTNILVTFREPLHSLTITDGQIIESGTNYAYINAGSNCVLSGLNYEHTTAVRKKKNPNILSGTIEKNVSVTDATLISSNNIEKVLDSCYNYLVTRNTTRTKIVEGKHEVYVGDNKYGASIYGSIVYGKASRSVGDVATTVYDRPVSVGELIETETEYIGDLTGRVIRQNFNLNGGIIIKDTVMR